MRSFPTWAAMALAVGTLASCVSEPPRGEVSPVGMNDSREHELPDPAALPWRDIEFQVPADSQLLADIENALDFRRREEFDRFLDARDPGELLEHATLTQLGLRNGGFDLEGLFVFGDELFEYEFRPQQGLGNGLAGRPGLHAGASPAPNLRRVHEAAFGGPDAHNCATCHFKGGPDGAGTNTQNAFLRGDGRSVSTADERNPPHLLGLGPVELLGRQMSRDLQAQRSAAIQEVRNTGRAVDVTLESKGVRFGILRVRADGTVDTERVKGVDGDLTVKPFGWKGHQATLRAMAEESFRIHLGVVSMHDQKRAQDGQIEARDYGDGVWYDIDRDGTTIEIDEGMLTSMVAYLAQLEVPVVRPPQSEMLLEYFARGRRLFDDIGCGSCHRPSLELDGSVLEIQGRDEAAALEAIRVDVARDGENPKVEPQRLGGTTYNVHLFSDLKRHDMGSELATERAQDGIPPAVFLTRSLWGLALTAPYLHDGRAPTVDDAIRLHGGDASAARTRYLQRPVDDRAALQVFLLSLTREPKLFVP